MFSDGIVRLALISETQVTLGGSDKLEVVADAQPPREHIFRGEPSPPCFNQIQSANEGLEEGLVVAWRDDVALVTGFRLGKPDGWQILPPNPAAGIQSPRFSFLIPLQPGEALPVKFLQPDGLVVGEALVVTDVDRTL